MFLHASVLWLGCLAVVGHAQLKVVQSWKSLQFSNPDDVGYEKEQNYPLDVDVAPDGRMFVTVERKTDVPSSLNTVTNKADDEGSLLLTAYPDWSWADTSSCDNLIGVSRITMDQCHRLWVLDDGTVNRESKCPPKLLVFNLTTDEVIMRIDIPNELVEDPNGNSRLVTVDAYTEEDCSGSKAFIADMLGNALLVWNGTSTFRIDSPAFAPDPNAVQFSVDGTDFKLSDGVLGIALTHDLGEPTEDKLLFFNPLSSFNMYYAKVADLNEENYNNNSIVYYREPVDLPSQSVTHAFSSKGVLFFNSVSDTSVLCWNRHKPFTPENIETVAKDAKTLQWVSSSKVRQSDDGEVLWLMTDRYQRVLDDSLDYDEVNFRVLAGLIDDLVKGTNCE